MIFKRFALVAVAGQLLIAGALITPASADNPDFYISSPAEGGTLTGTAATVTLTHSGMADLCNVDTYQWSVDGVAATTDVADPRQATQPDRSTRTQPFNTTRLSDGSHQISISAHCEAPNVGPDADFTATRGLIVRNVVPSVAIIQPADGADTYGRIIISADANADPGGSQHMTQVEFFLDGTSLGTDTLAPYEMSLDTTRLSNGPHTVNAVGADSAGLIGTSPNRQFQVGNLHSNLTITADRTQTGAGHAVTVRGSLRSVEDGAPIPSQVVDLYVRRADQSGWGRAASVTSASDGSVATTSAPLYSSVYRWQYAGGGSHTAAMSPGVAVSVVPLLRLSMRASAVNHGVVLRGAVGITPGNGGQPLVFQERRVGGSWVTLASGPSVPSSTGVHVTFAQRGYYDLRVYRRADVRGVAAASNVVRIRVF